jgi:two-component system response regulator GlrR
VVEGVDRGARAVATGDELTIGSADGSDLRLTDPAVSRHHCAIRARERGLELCDLESTNGTFVGDFEVTRGYIAPGSRLRLGGTTAVLTLTGDELEHPLAPEDHFGELLGESPAMRRIYPLLARCAASDATVLIEGESGTGKELVAEAIHAASARRDRPFVVVDCSALARQLAESELFGHVRGAFTGAEADRRGAFEEADGGTLFLDEIGELPLDLQPLLLRVLENQTIRRVGTNKQRSIDVRVIAASHRDLRVEVNAKRFRADLLYRLHVVRVLVPPLREREGDIGLLATHFWRAMYPGRPPPGSFLAELATHTWPGNVRELRNAVERHGVVGASAEAADPSGLSHAQAKEQAMREWERHWATHLIAEHRGNLTHAAQAARMGRSHLRRIVQLHGLRTRDDDDD